MVTPITQIAQRLKKLLPLLSSDKDGEAIAAVRAVDRLLRFVGADWHDLAGLVERAPAGGDDQSRDWRAMRETCLPHAHLLRAREHQFVIGLDSLRGRLTEKQQAWLDSIYARIKRAA